MLYSRENVVHAISAFLLFYSIFEFPFPSCPRAFHAKWINKNCAFLYWFRQLQWQNPTPTPISLATMVKHPHPTPISPATMKKHHCSCCFANSDGKILIKRDPLVNKF